MKAYLGGQAFNWPEELHNAITAFLEEIQVSELKGVVRHWVERVRWVLSRNDDYDHE
jgi:hypothetical protein